MNIQIILKIVDDALDFSGNYYKYILITLHLTYALLLFGIVAINPSYLRELNIFIQSFVCLFLIVKFNPFRKHVLKENDARIIFSSAIFLLINMGVIETARQFFDGKVEKITKKVSEIELLQELQS